jgi:hypothetical protein
VGRAWRLQQTLRDLPRWQRQAAALAARGNSAEAIGQAMGLHPDKVPHLLPRLLVQCDLTGWDDPLLGARMVRRALDGTPGLATIAARLPPKEEP